MLLIQACSSGSKDEASEQASDSDDAIAKELAEGADSTRNTEDDDKVEKVLKGAVPTSPVAIKKKLPGKKTYNSVEERKIAFFETLYPVVKKENEKVLEEARFVKKMKKRFSERDSLSDSAVTALKALGVKYRVKPKKLPSTDGFKELVKKVDVIPPELALIQAANESNWGRSRFAKEGNNLFGQWCFTEGCGIVPKRRSAGSGHEVAAFPNVQFSVRSYIRNLNSHPAYEPLRSARASMRKKGEEPTGHALAGGLTKYAGIGHDYVKILRSMMRSNQEYLEKASQVPPPILSVDAKEVELTEESS